MHGDRLAKHQDQRLALEKAVLRSLLAGAGSLDRPKFGLVDLKVVQHAADVAQYVVVTLVGHLRDLAGCHRQDSIGGGGEVHQFQADRWDSWDFQGPK